MKKLLFFLAALMFVTSCSKDTTTTLEVKGEKVVSFKVTAPKIQTRYGEGAEANQLFWAVYKNGQRLDDVSAIDPAEAVAINMSVDVEISLMEGIDYDILFWAQNENAPYTFDGEKVTIDYDALSANEEIYDAFFRNYHVDADQTEPHRVELRRPFAQLNIGTADLEKACAAGFNAEGTSIIVKTCTVLDLATGYATNPKEIAFDMSRMAEGKYNEFDIISMNYLLVNSDKELVDVRFEVVDDRYFWGDSDVEYQLIERTFYSVPIQRNHRTFVLGDLLTKKNKFFVEIIPSFENDIIGVFDIYYTTVDERPIYPSGVKDYIVRNTYRNGQGHITLNKPITEIEYGAFYDCKTLASIIIPNNINRIGDYAFYGCSNLTDITIPDSITSIGDYAFYKCSSITNITIPNSVNSIGVAAFGRCSNLEAFYGKWASSDNRSLIINNVLHSFAPAELTTYNIPEGVGIIGEKVFSGCANLTDITMPDSVTEIQKSAFESCSGLTNIELSDNVTILGWCAFMGCDGLTDITLPNSVTVIASDVFNGCSLESITLGKNITQIGHHGLSAGYGDLKRVNIPDLSSWCKIEFAIETANPLRYGTKLYINGVEAVDIEIPLDVTEVKDYAFCGCKSLSDVTISNRAIKIGKYAFWDCEGITSVTLPDGMAEIGEGAFANCKSLADIILPNSITKIAPQTFDGCESLVDITLSKSITEVGYMAFYFCDNLTNIYCMSANPPIAYYENTSSSKIWSAFKYIHASAKIYVPTKSVSKYQNADGWSDYADRIVDGGF